MFQHIPNASSKFQDIGPCDPNMTETEDIVGDYEIGKKLGEGHYGKVATGTDLSSNKRFAIKVLDKSRINRFNDLKQVAMEVYVLKHYEHPNIIHLREVIHAPKNLYIVTECCSMDLHKLQNDIGISEQAAKHVTFGILKPLQHLHTHGLCHLDLKPENILVTACADPKYLTHNDIRLCDFGLVKMAKNPAESKDIIRNGCVCGTPGFFAPEMILKNSFEGRKADMWSLGCCLLELTLGFTKEWMDTYELAKTSSSAFKDGLDACLDEIAPEYYPRHQKLLSIIHACLSINPKIRISSFDALNHSWLEDISAWDEGRQDDSPTLSFVAHDGQRGASVVPPIIC